MCTEGVIIAAGKSERMSPHLKLLLPLDGQSILRQSIFSMLPFVSRVLVVIGYRSEDIIEHIKDIEGVDIVNNPNHQQGMFSSIITGVSQVKGEHVFLLPADCPFVSNEVYQKMSQSNEDIVIPAYNNQAGHPIRLSRSAIRQLILESENSTLRSFIQRHPHRMIEVESPGILMDVDTPEDYKEAINYILKKEGNYE
ncbi:MAG: molybdopterin-guanine dinucleotide biosynthesis protein A [Firmicutes bacterium HGW-Firmicutes-10]|jgi:molybdenum cofactor cytidylyltransferase|nr:MAG: molybdopterin-guanine dinucleotide biosynthesis protein A [Firmicutes bacterium HGW-Firmicutes-10]